MLEKNPLGKIIDTTTDLNRSNFYNENIDRASVTKRTFYKRLEKGFDDGSFESFEDALTGKANARKKDLPKDIKEINNDAKVDFNDEFTDLSDNDEMWFWEEKVKKPYGA